MALLNWGNALSEAGKTMATMGLEGVKSVLEQDKIRLADELATKRETAMAELKHKHALGLLDRGEEIRQAGKRADILLETDEEIVTLKANAENRKLDLTIDKILEVEGKKDRQRTAINTEAAVEQEKALQAVRDARTIRLGTDPEWLKATAAIKSAEESPSTRAANMAAAGLNVVKADNERALQAARKTLAEATTPEAKKTAQLALDALTYDASAHRAGLTAASSVLKTTENLIANLNTTLASMLPNDPQRATVERRIADETSTYNALRDNYMKEAGIAKPPAAPAAAKTYSKADLERTMRSSGRSRSEVEAAYKANNITPSGK